MEFLITIFIFIALIAALFVISAANPIHSVFALIGLFVRSTGLLFTLHADFLAIILLIVYVGAIAVLFLFVIMMLHLNLLTSKEITTLRYLPITIIMGFVLIINFILLSYQLVSDLPTRTFNQYIQTEIHSINVFSDVLYSQYASFFIIRSLILFVAMIGAIVITHQRINNQKSKKQNTNNQLLRLIN